MAECAIFFSLWMWQKEIGFAELWGTRVVHPTLQNICIVAGFWFFLNNPIGILFVDL